MSIFKTIAVAFSMYSAIPMPQFAWSKDNMRFAMCAFPLIGIVIGVAEYLVWLVCSLFALPAVLSGCLFCLVPVWLTGGIHLDGFCDTSDALASHASREKKLEIMKDSHTGAFALIKVVSYMLLYFSLWCALPQFRALPIGLSFVLSRCLSGAAIASFPLAKNTGLAYTFAESADKKRSATLLYTAAAILILVLCFCGTGGMAVSLAAVLTFVFYYVFSVKMFGGITGDLAGWFLQLCELIMLAALLLVEYVEALI